MHEGRHDKQLRPVVPGHQQALDGFCGRCWASYRELRAYQQAPSPPAARLGGAFDPLFATRTGYAALDERLAKTAAKRRAWWRVRDKPDRPLSNTPAELGARRRVRTRDVRVGARSPTGAHAWAACHPISGTAQLLGVNGRHYLQDRFSGAYRLPALADLVRQRAADPAAPSLTAA